MPSKHTAAGLLLFVLFGFSLRWSGRGLIILLPKQPHGRQRHWSASSLRHSWSRRCGKLPSRQHCVTAGSVQTRCDRLGEPHTSLPVHVAGVRGAPLTGL